LQQCADHLGSAIGTPRVMCIMCRTVLAHASGTGTSLIHDYNRSSTCVKAREITRYDGRARRLLGIDVLTLLQKVPETRNRPRIIDLATPAGFNQHDFKEFFLKAFLPTNLAFNYSKNLGFRRVCKYIGRGVEISSLGYLVYRYDKCWFLTTLTWHLKRLGKSTVNDI